MSLTLLNRRSFLKSSASGLLLSGIATAARDHLAIGNEVRDVPWLEEIQRPPAQVSEKPIVLKPLLVGENDRPITSVSEWEAKRNSLKQWWVGFLGTMEVKRSTTPPKFSVVEEDRVEGVVRQLIRYDVEPGLPVDAYLLMPEKESAKCPGAICLHSTVSHSIRQPAAVEGVPEKAFGMKLAKRGFVSICPRNYLWPQNDRMAVNDEVKRFSSRHPKAKGMAKMLFDSQIALDILAAHPRVNADRICAVGHSLGAKEVLYLAAFDSRVRATVSSEGGIGTRFSNWDAAWYLGPEIKEPTFSHEHHELLAMIAPRPFLLIGGDSADGDRGWPFIEAALPVYRLYGTPARLGQFNHKKGHAVPPEAEQKIYEWLLAYT